MFDDVLEVLGERVERGEVREVLEAVNPDAVWLQLWKMGRVEVCDRPDLERERTGEVQRVAVAVAT
jgi:hypothetical protein